MAHPDDDDQTLLARWHTAADRAAFDGLVHRHAGLVYRAVARQLAPIDRHMADDVTQAVFLILHRKPKAAKSLPAWLHRTTRYAVVNAKRIAIRRRQHEAIAAAARPEGTMPPDSDSIHESLMLLLDEAIDSLGAADRATVIGRYLQNQDLPTLALVLGTTPEAARKRSERAMSKLQRFFQRRGIPGTTSAAVIGAFEAAQASAIATPTVVVPSPSAVRISRGAMQMLQLAKAKVVVIALLCAVAATVVPVVLAQDAGGERTQPTGERSTRRYDLADLIVGPNDLQSFADLIQNAVANARWRGEAGGSISTEESTLVIRQTVEAHLQVEHVLARLRQRTLNGGEPAPPRSRSPTADRNVGPLSLKGTGLGDAFDELRKATGQNIFVNWKALEAHWITRSLPVTIELSNLTLHEALNRMLTEVGSNYVRLGHVFHEGVVTVTTVEDLSGSTTTETYDIRKAITDEALRGAAVESVKTRVRGIDPLSWAEAGGTIGHMSELHGTLVVTHLPAMHERIAMELRDLLPVRMPHPQK